MESFPMRIQSLMLLACLAAACSDGGSPLTEEGGGPGPMLSPGTYAISDSFLSSNQLSAAANSSGNSNASWHLWSSGGSTVTIVSQSFTFSGQVTGASNSNWTTFPHVLNALIDADLLYSTGAAGSGTVGLSLR